MAHITGPPSPFFDLLHLDIRYPIASLIYQFLSISDIIAVSRTCRSLQNVYAALLPLEWNVDNILSRYVSDPKRFRAQMARCNTLVGDGVPLQFFERAVWKNESLNLYVDERDHQVVWEKYLTGVEGYECSDDSSNECGHRKMKFICRRAGPLTHSPCIWVTQILTQPISAILDFTKSTLFANCFSWNRAYSMYPLITFIHHEAVLHSPLSKSSKRSSTETYELRGWKFRYLQKSDGSIDVDTDSPFRLTRRVGDIYTWSIPFDVQGIDVTEVQPDFVLEYSAFSVMTPKNCPTVDGVFFTAGKYTSDVLKYAYTVGNDGWYNWLNKIMLYKTLEALHKLKVADRPEKYSFLVSNPEKLDYAMPAFEKPAYWGYCDDEIPRLYEQWKTALCHPGR